ncbi:MAG: hypothetical protein ACXACY_10270 [Candidatus Hodarchaeales archaeon]|jgi:hypothetical protein
MSFLFKSKKEKILDRLEKKLSEMDKKKLIELLLDIKENYGLDEIDAIKRSKDRLLIRSNTGIDVVPCIIHDDHTLSYAVPAKRKNGISKMVKTIEILTVPMTLTISILFRKRTFRIFECQIDGEYTVDFSQDVTPIEAKKRIETLLKLHNVAKKSDIVGNVLKGLKGTKSWMEYIPYVAIVGVVFVFGLLISQYNLIKP